MIMIFLHGGNWYNDINGCRTTYRRKIWTDYQINNVSFRIIKQT